MTTRVEITQQQYNQLAKTGVEVEVKYYLIASSGKTIAASKSKIKRRSPKSIVTLNENWFDISLPTAHSDMIALEISNVMGNLDSGQVLSSNGLAEILAARMGVDKKAASQYIGRMAKRGVINCD